MMMTTPCLAFWLTLTVSGVSGAGDDAIILRQDFSRIADGSRPADWQADHAGWMVENGRLRGAAPTGESTLLFGSLAWRDVALAADVRFVDAEGDAQWVALLIRQGGGDAPGIQLVVRLDAKRSNGLEISTRTPKSSGGKRRVFQTAAAHVNFRSGAAHRLRLEARGEWIRAFVDGEKVFECPRGSDASPAGRVGLRVNGAVVEFDNVEVTRLDPLEPADLRRLRTRPLVVAHRGFSWRAPENTLAAYRLAVDAGADLAECDVWLSSDGVPVLLHDEQLKRTTGLDAKVGDLSVAELQELDAGSWKSTEFAAERIPTLRQALELVNGRLRFVIEIKPRGMEKQVIAAIHDAGVDPADVMIFCFHRDVVETIARLEPRLPTTWLIGNLPWQAAQRRQVLSDALRARVSAIGLPLTRVDPAIVRWAHESGFLVFVWTVNEPSDMRYLARIGVDGIISDRPDVLLEVLEGRE